MSGAFQKLNILLVDDSEDDILMARTVFEQLKFPHTLETINCPKLALDYLLCAGKYAARKPVAPDLMLLDINMPLMDGFALLRVIKSTPALKRIPVIMLSSSNSQNDITRSFDHGAASFITKPSSFDGYVNLMSDFGKYWLSVSALPL
jgi:CheY-like chemotaxis protein